MRIFIVTLIVLFGIFLGFAVYWNYFAFRNEELEIKLLQTELQKIKAKEAKTNNDSLENSLARITENIALIRYNLKPNEQKTMLVLNNYEIVLDPLNKIVNNNKKAHIQLVFIENQIKNLQTDISNKNTKKELLNKYLTSEKKRISELFEYFKSTEPLVLKLNSIDFEYSKRVDCYMSKLSACE